MPSLAHAVPQPRHGALVSPVALHATPRHGRRLPAPGNLHLHQRSGSGYQAVDAAHRQAVTAIAPVTLSCREPGIHACQYRRACVLARHCSAARPQGRYPTPTRAPAMATQHRPIRRRLDRVSQLDTFNRILASLLPGHA